MAFDGNGTYTLPTPQYPAIAGTLIDAVAYNQILVDLANALSLVLVRDGQAPMTGNLNMATHKVQNVLAAVADTDVPTLAQIREAFTMNNPTLNNVAIAIAVLTGVINATGATLTIPTAAPGDSSSLAASTQFVATQAFATSLPGQAGNASKFVTTNGVVASWSALPASVPLQLSSFLGGF